jgi:putative flippase GtrA
VLTASSASHGNNKPEKTCAIPIRLTALPGYTDGVRYGRIARQKNNAGLVIPLLVPAPTSQSFVNQLLVKQLLRFSAAGTAGFIIDAGLVEVLKGTLGLTGSQLVAFSVAATATWALNRQFTFGSSAYPLHVEWLRYIASNLLGSAVNNVVYFWAVMQFAEASKHPVVAVAAGSIAGMFFTFAASRHIAFKKRKDRSPSGSLSVDS